MSFKLITSVYRCFFCLFIMTINKKVSVINIKYFFINSYQQTIQNTTNCTLTDCNTTTNTAARSSSSSSPAVAPVYCSSRSQPLQHAPSTHCYCCPLHLLAAAPHAAPHPPLLEPQLYVKNSQQKNHNQ